MTVKNEEKPEKGQSIWKKIASLIITILSVIILIIIFIALLLRFFCREHCGGELTQCQSNLKNIGTALEMYAVDNNGQFPDSLSKLAPEYLKEIPGCGVAGKDTYSKSYQFCNSNKFNFTFTMDGKKYYDYSIETAAYTLYCSGRYHEKFGIGPNYPQYNSRAGLVPR